VAAQESPASRGSHTIKDVSPLLPLPLAVAVHLSGILIMVLTFQAPMQRHQRSTRFVFSFHSVATGFHLKFTIFRCLMCQWRSHRELLCSINSEQTSCAVDCEVRAAQVVLLRTIETSLQRSESINDAAGDDADQTVIFRVPAGEDARLASTAARAVSDSGSVSVGASRLATGSGSGSSGDISGATDLTPRDESNFSCVSRLVSRFLRSFACELILIVGLAVIIFGVIVYVILAEIAKLR
jgi:hypothetical protein